MIKYLTSDFRNYKDGNIIGIDNTNGFVDSLKDNLKGNEKIVFVVSSGSLEHEKNMIYANILFQSLKMVGIEFKNYCVLENETRDRASEYISNADLVYLCGGDAYTQMEFFNEINLKELLTYYNGIVIGQSAGAINMAHKTFNSPESEEDVHTVYEGLGLTNINIEPHFPPDDNEFQMNSILKESKKRIIYGQCNGSHIMIDNNDNVIVFGETYKIQNEIVTRICNDMESVELNSNLIKVSKR